MPNKVEFGISNLHVGTYVDNNGTITLGTPYHQKGSVSFSPEEKSDSSNFYADNIAYYSTFSGGSIEGDLEVAMFDDDFKTQFLGYVALTDGGLANVKNATKPNVYIAFQVEGDVESRKVILYNCALGAITREYSTIEESKEPTIMYPYYNGNNGNVDTEASAQSYVRLATPQEIKIYLKLNRKKRIYGHN